MPERGLKDLGEDATGFGAVEMRTIWHSITRPAAVLDAYMKGGADGGGEYSRPIRLYLGLCGVMMLVSFAMGGVENQLDGMLSPELLAPLLQASGKSRDAFLADADGWISLLLVPILSFFFALGLAPLMRWWDPEDLRWRKAFGATFAYLNAWTILILPFCWMAYYEPTVMAGQVIVLVASIVTFIRMGKDRWWRTGIGAALKAVGLFLAVQVSGMFGGLLLGGIGILGGMFGA